MERRDSRSRSDRREVHSVCMPVPTIILNNLNNSGNTGQGVLSHSRSVGDLDKALDQWDYKMAGKSEGLANISGSVTDGMYDKSQKHVNPIGLYCSPRMPRRLAKTPEEPPLQQSELCLDSFNACNLNYLGPGSQVGSTVSLNSEYTSRSVGLISNDSNSESSQHNYQCVMTEDYVQKHSVLKRFYSNPEKDDEILNNIAPRNRTSKSMGNMQDKGIENDSESGSTTDEKIQHIFETSCDIDESLAERTGYPDEGSSLDSQSEQNLVTAITENASLRDGRIQKWLTEISVPGENSNS